MCQIFIQIIDGFYKYLDLKEDRDTLAGQVLVKSVRLQTNIDAIIIIYGAAGFFISKSLVCRQERLFKTISAQFLAARSRNGREDMLNLKKVDHFGTL